MIIRATQPSMKRCLLIGLGILALHAYALQARNLKATRTNSLIQIDGRLQEADWDRSEAGSDFTQYDPTSGNPPSQKTEVKVLYDDAALYVAFICYDSSPDSILTQLGLRDADNLNADWVRVSIDTYNANQDAYNFGVSAVGVQFDFRYSDFTYNAVWDSKTRITEEGWIAEIKIPFSAIRFPGAEEQEWSIQFERQIRRHRELVQWAPVTKGEQNFQRFWGKISGINSVKSPIRLQLTPYVSLLGQHYPNDDNEVKDFNTTFSGGMDLKYGISESFTLDMTLLPDFSQVRSDDLIKNLTAFEQVLEEQRAFFQEGVDLFERGDLFYSRRIGARPSLYFDAEDQLETGEELIGNPSKSLLVNASKVSGRTKSGLGIGFLNAIHRDTNAEIRKTDGSTRKFLTSPASNYNIMVVDQLMKNNSSAYLINTNVSRFDDNFRSANVTGAGATIGNKKGSHQLNAGAALSNINHKSLQDNETGYRYQLGFEKIQSAVQWEIASEGFSPDFDPNDAGLEFFQDLMQHSGMIRYALFDPKYGFNFGELRTSLAVRQQMSTGRLLEKKMEWNAFGVISSNFLAVWTGGEWQIGDAIDLFEARKDKQIYRSPPWIGSWVGFSSDYRKPFALDGNFFFATQTRQEGIAYNIMIRPLVRVNDKLSFSHEFFHRTLITEQGYADTDDQDNPVFGHRDVHIYNNTLSAKYLFSSNMSIDLRGRHYWSRANYKKYFDIDEDGYLFERPDWNGNSDFNYNVFNIDLIYAWQFAPGSWLNIVYKNFLENDSDEIETSFFSNLGNTLREPQTNSFSIKLLYFFDYASRHNIFKN